MNTLIIAEDVLIIKGDATVQLRISAVLLRKPGRWAVPYAILCLESHLCLPIYSCFFLLYSNNQVLYDCNFAKSQAIILTLKKILRNFLIKTQCCS